MEEHNIKLNNLCNCGCGIAVRNKFVYGHNRRNKQTADTTKAKLSEAGKNRKHSEETKRRISESHLGKKHSEETKLKISKTRKHLLFDNLELLEKYRQGSKGNKNSIGHRHSEISKRKMSDAQKSRQRKKGYKFTDKARENIRKGCLGRKLSAETIEKIMKYGGRKRFPYISKEHKIIKIRSNWEVIYAHYLDSMNYTWLYEPKMFKLSTEKYYLPDFFIETLNEWHEVKGYLSKIAQEKIVLFHKEYSSLVYKIVDAFSLRQLKLIKEADVLYGTDNE